MEVITPMIPLYFFKYYLTQGRNDTANGMKHIRRQVNNQRKSLQQRLRISIDQTKNNTFKDVLSYAQFIFCCNAIPLMLSMYPSKNVKLYIKPHELQVTNKLLINWVKKFRISK